MLFNSIHFLLFFPITTLVYFCLPHRTRWAFLLCASAYFYICFIPQYILILLGTIAVDYVAGLFIESAAGSRRKIYLCASIVANVGVLAFFKYANFALSTVDAIRAHLASHPPEGLHLDIILPIGLSFHTFQSMSYTIEVYRGNQKAERHLGIFALYVLFYPQLVAGPIERPQNLLHQFREEHSFDYQRVTSGLKLMTWGMIKKVVVADRLAPMVDVIYQRPQSHDGPVLLFATILFAFQIYCDFSGYSDIALGSAEVLGFKLMKNFDRPYASTSISEFWRRWHISLSTWFRDYLYIPLGGNRGSLARTIINLLIVFVLSGLWHGASWNFVLWGALHGAFLAVALLTARARSRLGLASASAKRGAPSSRLERAVGVTTTFTLVTFTWVFFRAKTIGDAIYVLTHWHHGIRRLAHPSVLVQTIHELTVSTSTGLFAFFAGALGIVGLELVQHYQAKGSLRQRLAMQPASRRWVLYSLTMFVLLLFAQTSRPSSFIYFQF